MSRVRINIPREQLIEAIKKAEQYKNFSNRNQLYRYISDTEWGRFGCRDENGRVRSLSPALIYQRVREYNLDEFIRSTITAPFGGDNTTDEQKQEGGFDDFSYSEVNLNPGFYFSEIYDREDQREVILSALDAAITSEMQNRFHCILWGEPGCGKSDLLSATGKMLGEEDEAYIKLDATSTTMVGILKRLFNDRVIPPVLMIEEIEKAPEDSLRWLLGLMDSRAEIRKVDARAGSLKRSVPVLVLATANDINKFRRSLSGALASRFSFEIECPRPSRAILYKILEREVNKIEGDTDWIEPTLKFCYDDLGWTDPRKIIPVCLAGKDKLITGKFQKAISAVDPNLRKKIRNAEEIKDDGDLHDFVGEMLSALKED